MQSCVILLFTLVFGHMARQRHVACLCVVSRTNLAWKEQACSHLDTLLFVLRGDAQSWQGLPRASLRCEV